MEGGPEQTGHDGEFFGFFLDAFKHIYINDVTDGFHDVSAKLFADDLKLYTEINSPLSESNFQSHLDRIYIWAGSWQLSISYSECCIMKLGHQSSPSSFTFQNTHISSSNLVM